MTERSLLLLPLLSSACTVTDLGTLDRLEAAYGDETTALAIPATTAAVILGGLAAEACLAGDEGGWGSLVPGDALPVDPALAAALGDPAVADVSADGEAVELLLTGAGLGGREDLSLLLTVVDASPVLVSVTGEADDATVLTADLQIAAGCSEERSRVDGAVTLFGDALDATVVFPAPDAEVDGVDYPGAAAWLPAAGTARWSSTIAGIQRTVRTEDASRITLAGDTATWPGTAEGGETASEAGWEAEVALLLTP